MLEDSDATLQPYAEIIIANAMNDCEMQRRQTKIIWKKEELAKSESTIATHKSNIDQLEKSIQVAQERLKKIESNIDLHRSTKQITEELLISMKHEYKIVQQKRENTRISRDQILDKYKQIFKSYKETYKSLPWNQENHKLQLAIDIERIHLNILKTEYSQLKKKIFLFRTINDKRMTVAIVNLAKYISVRNNLKKDINIINEETIECENKISALRKEKDLVQEQINLKVKAAVAEARERAVKAQSNVGTPKTAACPEPPAPIKQSIFSRLGINGPLTLKRLSGSTPPVPEKLLRHSSTEIPLPQYPWKHQEKISDMVKEKPEVVKNIPLNREVAKAPEKEVPPSPPKGISKEKPVNPPTKAAPEQDPQARASTSSSAVQGSQEPGMEELEKTNKIIKTKKKAPTVALTEKPEEIQEKITKQSSDTVSVQDEPVQAKLQNEQAKPQTIQAKPQTTQAKPQTKEAKPQDAPQTKEKVIEDEITEMAHDQAEYQPPTTATGEVREASHHNVRLSPEKTQPETLEESGNFADNSSMDNDSVLSLNFGITNRDELNELVSRNLDSPDFFIQRPGGFCFSPPFGKSGSPEKSDKGKKPVADFMNAMSPLFSEEKSKKAGGPSSSFDFFGSSSPKKNDSSTKSFFQLFG